MQRFETKPTGMPRLMFEALVTSASREELASSFRERNRESRPTPLAPANDVIVAAPEQLGEALKREATRIYGYTSFSLPGYSSDGHALVYVSYVCGGLCGTGWFYLLERSGPSWKVVASEMLWIS